MGTRFWQIISDKNLWDKSLLELPEKNFLQSASFGIFNENLGEKVWRYGVLNSSRVVSFALVLKKESKLGSFLYIPWGPLLEGDNDLPLLIETLTRLAREEKVNFIRLEPRKELIGWQKVGLKPTTNYIQPECSLVLDLTKSLDDLRKDLSESTRYNVGWVERQGVKVETSKKLEEFETFLKLLKETATRQRFTLHKSIRYYSEQFKAFAVNNYSKLFIAKSPSGNPLAAAIVIYFGDTVTYLHAASSSEEQKLRAPYLMQWKIIEDAKNSGAKKYDFWGIAPTDKQSEAWAGITTFKKSFGGERVSYPRPYDLVISNKYYLVNILEELRKLPKLLRK